MYRLFRHADDVRACLDITRIGFVRFGDDDDGLLRTRRVLCYRFARWFAVCNYCILLMWSSLPFLVGSEQRVLVRNIDGSTDSYRCNPFNMYFAVSVDTYNRYAPCRERCCLDRKSKGKKHYKKKNQKKKLLIYTGSSGKLIKHHVDDKNGQCSKQWRTWKSSKMVPCLGRKRCLLLLYF